jgi:beta-lactam-binding protein with PASTA domain
VPDVTGLSLQQASDRIEAAGLTITASSFGDKEPAPDEVASCQAPEGGTLVDANTKVLVIFD